MGKNVGKNIDKERVLALLNEREKEVERLELDMIIAASGVFKASLRTSWKILFHQWTEEDCNNKEIWSKENQYEEFLNKMRHILNRRKYSSGAERNVIFYLAYIEWMCDLQEKELVDVELEERTKEIFDDDGSHKNYYANVRLGELLGVNFAKNMSKYDKALENTPVILQKGMGLRKALRLKELLEAAGAKVNLIYYKKAEEQADV